MADPIAILAEGVADDEFLEKLLEFRHLEELFDVRKPQPFYTFPKIDCPHCGRDFQPEREAAGTGGFGKRLKMIKFLQDQERKKFKHVVIVVDSDEDHDASFAQVQNKIHAASDFDVPVHPYQLSNPGKYPSVAVAMLPKDSNGCLETLCLESLNPKYAGHLKCVEAAAKCVGADGWSMVMEAKFKVQCLLSSICQKNPYTPLKHAWSRDPARSWYGDVFQLNHAAFDPLTEFLHSLTK